MRNTVDQKEIQHFSKDADAWWDENGPFKPLHRLNPVRLSYIKAQICEHFGRDEKSLRPFEGLKILDIGCGGGLVCEPLARLGADVCGADADKVAIETAKVHAEMMGLSIDYFNGAAEDLIHTPSRTSPSSSRPSHSSSRAKSRDLKMDQIPPLPAVGRNDSEGKIAQQFDVVLALEILEHVDNPAAFVDNVAKLAKPDGLVIFSTLNRNPKSFALGIVAAEYLLRWVPKGTHNWKKFVKPSELAKLARSAGLKPHDITGLIFDPLQGEFRLSKNDLDVNYLLSCKKG